ncbi:hypothetical protein Scep_006846 [Stephania cephalantha]|uniref:Uncharacterized protein n=1 Tax=Stephania cephalantha TaxID=152367 RepID=A0AAP0PMM1_9MAGN
MFLPSAFLCLELPALQSLQETSPPYSIVVFQNQNGLLSIHYYFPYLNNASSRILQLLNEDSIPPLSVPPSDASLLARALPKCPFEPIHLLFGQVKCEISKSSSFIQGHSSIFPFVDSEDFTFNPEPPPVAVPHPIGLLLSAPPSSTPSLT